MGRRLGSGDGPCSWTSAFWLWLLAIFVWILPVASGHYVDSTSHVGTACSVGHSRPPESPARPSNAFSVSDHLRRVGEATNPGPCPHTLQIGTTNPSGFRGKEAVLLECGPGIFGLSETQLSCHTQKSTRAAVSALGRSSHRHVRTFFGAPAPLRPGSLWAGSWTGVLQMSDYPVRPLHIPLPPGAWTSGRIMIAQHSVSQIPVTVATVYGFPSGPTFPDALARTEALLEPLTRELVIGRSGVRIICGDVNQDESALRQVSIWRQHGWVEAQCLAFDRWAQPIVNTCKHATKRDVIYLSPEAAAACCSVQVKADYMEHHTVIANLSLEVLGDPIRKWPLPGEIPWDDVDISSWHSQFVPDIPACATSTDWMKRFATQFESSLHGFVTSRPGGGLPSGCQGRSRRTQPAASTSGLVCLRASRPGEEVLGHDFLGQEIKQQLRRIQSLVHATKSNSLTPGATEYRASLWRAIRQAKGFKSGFPTWWRTRHVQLQGSPQSLPLGVPQAAMVQALFVDYRENFRRLEAWSIRKREAVLKCKMESSCNELYRAIRTPAAPQVDCLVLRHVYAAEPEASCPDRLILDRPLDTRGTSTWHLDGRRVQIMPDSATTCHVLDFELPVDEVELVQSQVLATAREVQAEFEGVWAKRWQQHADCTASHWQRIASFAEAYLPHLSLTLPNLTPALWLAQVRKLKPRAARGPDAWARRDLLEMPLARVQQLLSLLLLVESGQVSWPEQMLTGFVIALAKPNDHEDTSGYRPICLFSVIYRCWSSLRAQQILRRLEPWLDSDMLGFLPRREASELWFVVQSQIELCLQAGTTLSGFSSDIAKAFNCLPRLPLLRVAKQFGIPDSVLVPWHGFLQGIQRRFKFVRELGMLSSAVPAFQKATPSALWRWFWPMPFSILT